MFQAFFDESGTHTGAPVLCVAGYAGSQAEWLLFTDEWRERLNQFNISCFHAKEPNCNILRPYLAKAILNRELVGFICSVDPATYKAYASAQVKSSMGNAYAACVFMCAWWMRQWADENSLGSLSIVYEAGQPNANFIQRAFNAMMAESGDFGVSAFAMAKKEEFIPLQATDFLSHVYSTKDVIWSKQLAAKGNIIKAAITQEQLKDVSDKAQRAISEQRNKRRRALRAIKLNMGV